MLPPLPRRNIEFYGSQKQDSKTVTFSGHYAIKWFPAGDRNPEPGFHLLTELSVLRRLQHQNIIKLIDYIDIPGAFALVMHRTDGDLSYLLKSRSLTPSQQKNVGYQLFSGIAYIHSQGIIHRDIKPENILYYCRDSIEIKISDFDLSHSFVQSDTPLRTKAYTLWYSAPEVILLDNSTMVYTTAADIWAAGLVMWEISGNPPLFTSDCTMGQLKAICSILGPPARAKLETSISTSIIWQLYSTVK